MTTEFDASTGLTHFDAGGHARMVDVGAKDATTRVAVASGRIAMRPATLAVIEAGTAKKGDVLGVARIAAIQGAKRTSELIPLCHPIAITRVDIAFGIERAAASAASSTSASVTCTATVACTGPTGVEMEALTAVQVGLLTVYDMCKAIDRGMTITDVALVSKSGGASGDWKRG